MTARRKTRLLNIDEGRWGRRWPGPGPYFNYDTALAILGVDREYFNDMIRSGMMPATVQLGAKPLPLKFSRRDVQEVTALLERTFPGYRAQVVAMLKGGEA